MWAKYHGFISFYLNNRLCKQMVTFGGKAPTSKMAHGCKFMWAPRKSRSAQRCDNERLIRDYCWFQRKESSRNLLWRIRQPISIHFGCPQMSAYLLVISASTSTWGRTWKSDNEFASTFLHLITRMFWLCQSLFWPQILQHILLVQPIIWHPTKRPDFPQKNAIRPSWKWF